MTDNSGSVTMNNVSFMKPAGVRDRYAVPMKPSVVSGFFEESVASRDEQMMRLHERVEQAFDAVAGVVIDATTDAVEAADVTINADTTMMQPAAEFDEDAVFAMYADAEDALIDDADNDFDNDDVDDFDIDIDDVLDVPDVLMVDVDEDMF